MGVRGGGGAHQAARTLLSSSSSESLSMVMMLAAGLGVSEMTMGWERSPEGGLHGVGEGGGGRNPGQDNTGLKTRAEPTKRIM